MKFAKHLTRSITHSLFIAAIGLTSLVSTRAEAGEFGLGIILGSPSAISAKYNMDRSRAIDAGLAFATDGYFLIYGDYLGHFPGAFGRSNEFVANLTPYIGVGPIFAFASGDRRDNRYFDSRNDDFALGVRVPLGLEWRAPRFPIGVSLELAPGLTVLPGTNGFVQGGVAVRYYF